MFLKSFSYSEYLEDQSKRWILEKFNLHNINLFVGDNASGKSRTLRYINQLSRILLSSKSTFISGNYEVSFISKENEEFYLNISFKDGKIEQECLKRGSEILLERNSEGEGRIYNIAFGAYSRFKIPEEELICSRRDELQFPYLDLLYKWASNVRHFRFSKEEEKNRLVLIDSNQPLSLGSLSRNMTNQSLEVFRKGNIEFKDEFVKNIIDDFNAIGYNISKVDVGALHSVKIDIPSRNKIVGLRVHEDDRHSLTDQNEMSDGMFRALSLIIHYNYYQLTDSELTVLVDDIGEGLDFNRSTNLIKLLIAKSEKSNIQLIMSSNDKFVLNNTDLKYWQIVKRECHKVNICNHENSKSKFDNFKFLGLNNFDFYIGDFFNNDWEDEI